MNIFDKTIQKIHKVVALVIALFFVMWFITGIVLLYHKYPKVTEEDNYGYMQRIPAETLPAVAQLPGLTDTTEIINLSVCRNLGATVWTIGRSSGRKENAMDKKSRNSQLFVLTGDSLTVQHKITSSQIDSIACLWAGSAAIASVDTLRRRQQWILYDRYEKSLPILRYRFEDPEATEVFISQKNGEVVQKTTRSARIWAWLGAIPHKFYFPGIRTNTGRWKNVMLAGGLLCLAAALSGMYMGIYYLLKNKRKHHKFSSPFKKRMWRLHHVAGLIFGVFLMAWGISGALSTQRIPKWLIPYDGDYTVNASGLWGKKPLLLGDYKLDYRKILDVYHDVKSITWHHFGKQPAYIVVDGDREIFIDASRQDRVQPLKISKEEIEKAVRRYFGDEVSFDMTYMEDYDEYYLSARGLQPLPVWKIEIDNEDGSRLYISPGSGYVKYLNENRMAKKWLFSAAHYLDIKFFVMHPALRYLSLWILAAGCVLVIVTGLAIAFSKEKSKHKKI